MTNLTSKRIDQNEIHLTPRGQVAWSSLIIPSKYNEFAIVMKFEDSVADEFLQTMNEFYERAYEEVRCAKAVKQLPRELPPWRIEKDGRMGFRFKQKAGGIKDGRPWTADPVKFFNADRVLIENDLDRFRRFGPGTIVRTSFQLKPYFVQKAGITLKLKAVQIVKFIPHDSAEYFGFQQEDGEGYFVSDSPKAEPESPTFPAMNDVAADDPFAPFGIDDAKPAPAPVFAVTDDDIPF